MGVIRSAIGDAVLTSMWVFSMPLLRIFTGIIATYLGVQAIPLADLFITINLVTLMVLGFSLVGTLFGGASFNPTSTVSFYAAGLRPDSSLLSMAVRFPAQAAGGVAGAKAILQVMPQKHKYVLGGPSLKVDMHTGAIAEGMLTFVLCLALLVAMLKGPKNPLLKVWLVAVVTVGLVINGAKYTGPSMNPANAFGWAYVNNWHYTWELYYVYWICPLIAAVVAGWVYRLLFPKPVMKQKKA
ncbi:hypothetical protein SLE2022_065890 [Rubroshorea leprosula]